MYSKTTGDLLKTLLRADEYSQFQELKDNQYFCTRPPCSAILFDF